MVTTVGGLVTDIGEQPCGLSCLTDPWLIYCGQEIRAHRLARGLTLKALGEAVGLSESHVSHIENGTHWARLVKLFRLWRYLNMQPFYPFVPHVPAAQASTVELFMRASPEIQQAIRQFLVATDTVMPG